MRNNYYILMADIIGSRNKVQKTLMTDFKKVTDIINRTEKESIISPITITLGDEFQCVLKNLSSALEVIVAMEEQIVYNKNNFKLRYVLYYGEIETQINKKKAYEMLGEGLTKAREMLILRKNKEKNFRFSFHLDDVITTEALNNVFIIYQSVVDNWKIDKDFELVKTLLRFTDYKIVAEKMHKDPSLIWKRKKSVQINEYLAVKKLIEYIGIKK